MIIIDGLEMQKTNLMLLVEPDGKVWEMGDLLGNDKLLDGVKAIPAADVRPVVLGRDCVMYECHEYDGGLKYVCRLFKRQMQETDFCSYGEKREES